MDSIIDFILAAEHRQFRRVVPEVFDRERIESSPGGSAEFAVSMQAVDLLWSAASKLRVDITYRCILAGLTLVDILHALDVPDARPILCGVEISRGPLSHSITCGNPKTERHPKMMNGHVVVRVGNIVVDPVIAQMRRWWNDIPQAAILPAFTAAESRSSWLETVTKDFEPVKRFAQGFTKSGFELSYFELPKASAKRARDWMLFPDADFNRRAPIAREAIRILAQAERSQQAA